MKNKNTIIKSIRLKQSVVEEITKLAFKENRNFTNMAETLILKAMKSEYNIELE